ncbi:MAG: hypothetical protein U0169_21625 [Polyangiaceae bacterium]
MNSPASKVRRLPSLVAAFALAATTFGTPSAARAELVPGVDTLPEGHIPTASESVFEKQPARVAANEKVDGITAEIQSRGRKGRFGDVTYVQVKDKVARSCLRSNDGTEFKHRRRKLSREDSALRPFFEDSLHMMTTEWGGDGETMVPAHVQFVRRERLVPAGNDAKLEITDFWFDPVTQGARLVAKTDVKLRAIGTSIDDAKIWAMRDGKSFGIVLGRPATDGGGDGVLSNDDRFSTRCGHAVVVLSTDEDSDMVTMDENVSVRTEAPKSDGAKSARSSAESASVLAKFAGGKELLGTPVVPTGTVERVNRTFRVSVGVSQTVADKIPVISVSRAFVGMPIGSPFEDSEAADVDRE